MFACRRSARRVMPSAAEPPTAPNDPEDKTERSSADQTSQSESATSSSPFARSSYWMLSQRSSGTSSRRFSRSASHDTRGDTSTRSRARRSLAALVPRLPIKLQRAGEWIPLGRRARNCLKKHPLTGWYFRMCDSVLFWRIYPWVFALAIYFFANFFTLVFCVKYIAFDDAMFTTFLWTYGAALAAGFLLFDVITIIVRNNVGWMRKILATKRYQVIEKFVVAPIAGFFKMLIFKFDKFFGC